MLHSVHFFLIIFILVIISITDSRHKKIPNRYVIMTVALSSSNALFRIVAGQSSVFTIIAGAVVGGIILLPAFFITGKSFGAGDIKLLSALGIGMGAGNNILCTGVAMAGALVYALVRKKSTNGSIAMAPFILFSYILTCYQ